MKVCFSAMDVDADGVITEKDLKAFMGDEVSDEYVSNMMFTADKNFDGSMDLDEFSAVMLKVLATYEKMR